MLTQDGPTGFQPNPEWPIWDPHSPHMGSDYGKPRNANNRGYLVLVASTWAGRGYLRLGQIPKSKLSELLTTDRDHLWLRQALTSRQLGLFGATREYL